MYRFHFMILVSSLAVSDCRCYHLLTRRLLRRSSCTFATTTLQQQQKHPNHASHCINTNDRLNINIGRRMLTSDDLFDVRSSDNNIDDENNSNSPENTPSSTLLGGTYVGLTSTFDVVNNNNIGTHIPIDTRYIPPSLVEWGYIPHTLETIVFETIADQRTPPPNNKKNNDTTTNDTTNEPTISPTTSATVRNTLNMTRSVYTILPATGCDNDNLETIHSTERYTNSQYYTTNFESNHYQQYDDDTTALHSTTTTTSTITYQQSNNNNDNRSCSKEIGIETCFRWLPDTGIGDDNIDDTANNNNDLYRIRVNVNLQRQQLQEQMIDDTNNNASTSNKNDTLMVQGASSNKRIWKLINPVRVSIEKQLVLLSSSTTTTTTSAGIIDPDNFMNSGGLDSRTVTHWLGPILHGEQMRSFPIQQPQQHLLPMNDTSYQHSNRNVIWIPGNITISTVQSDDEDDDDSFQIDIGHVVSPLTVTETTTSCDIDVTQRRRHIIVAHTISPTDDIGQHLDVSSRIVEI